MNDHVRSLLSSHGGKLGQHILTAATVAQAVAPAVKWYVDRNKAQAQNLESAYVVTIRPGDALFLDAREWLFDSIPASKRRAVELTGASRPPYFQIQFDETTKQTVRVGGHTITAEMVKSEDTPAYYLQIVARSVEGRDTIINEIATLYAARWTKVTKPTAWMPNSYGEWNRRDDIRERKIESVILKDGQLESLIADVENFLASEDDYSLFGQPWHRGYLFHGPPGTGKTSVARAVATHFGLPIFYLALADIGKDADLVALVSGLQEKSILLIEDADGFHSTTDRGEKSEMTSLSTVLNVLDGMWTPEGLITIMTTNHLQSLDKALIRPGRADVHEYFSELDESQASRLGQYVELECDHGDFVGQAPAELLAAAHRERFSARVKVQ